jgi:tetratricopeptide (TPR) repeat protein
MKASYARALTLLILALCFASTAFGQIGSIYGKVLDKDGKPISGATVIIDREEIKLHQEVKTDKNGNYQRMGVDDGDYKVSVVQNGNTLASAIVSVSLGFRVDKNFDLSKPETAATGGGSVPNKALADAEAKANSGTQGAYGAGVTALNAKNFDEAIKQFTLAVQRQPKMPMLFAKLAEANAGARKNPEAIDAYKKAIELNAAEPDYRYQLGMLYLQTNSMADAATQFDKYLQLDPKGANAATAKQLLDAAKGAK